ncbi:MAG: glycoside hydrolase family 13 protein, partial [Anaerolineae bacterium]
MKKTFSSSPLKPFVAGLIVFLFLLTTGAIGAPPALSAPPRTLGFVGNMSPAGGSTTTLTIPASFNVSVEVWKSGVTNASGQGAGITCTLHWGTVGYFGGTWSNVTDTAMTYIADVLNNDKYQATITPGVGLYEFTANCTDTTDNSTTWVGGANGKLIIHSTGSAGCNTAAQGDNNVFWTGLLHDSFSTTYRNPTGAVPTTQGTITLKFRTCMNDLNQQPRIRVYSLANASEVITPGNANSLLSFSSHATDATAADVTFWTLTLTAPNTVDVYYYVFQAVDGTNTAYYFSQLSGSYGGGNTNPGGIGQAGATQTTAYDNSYQLTIYDSAFTTPSWMQRGVIYHIFPERFRDGNSSNNPAANRFFYGVNSSIVRSNQSNWNFTICDPRNVVSPTCNNHYSDNFYGGDLQGITDKINQGFFDNLGVSVIYINPIFSSSSNHKYDTRDYLTIDPDFGTLTDFQTMTAAAHAHGIKIMLDGVFNHTSSDSIYFDRYNQYTNTGACESTSAADRGWYFFTNVAAGTGTCVGSAGANSATYTAWAGYDSLPKLNAPTAAVEALIWNNGNSSVAQYWLNQGADGWRFDVGGEVDGGTPGNGYWRGFRSTVKAGGAYPNSLMLGEEWGNASAWLLGNEWDSVMNYRFRSAMLSWLYTGCVANSNGCNGAGTLFQENDMNTSSSSGAISYISPSQFNTRLRTIQENYPPAAFKAMMNLADSHDTSRVLYLLKRGNNDNASAASQRLKEWWLMAFSYPGAPTLYYGDEVGLTADDVYDGSLLQDDPYNRAPYPWPDASGSSYATDTTNLLPFERQMASMRWSYRALQDGDVQHGIVIDDANKLYGYARTGTFSGQTQTALIVLNRDSSSHNVTLTGLNATPYSLANGTVMVDAVNGGTTTVAGGQLTVTVNPTWGVVLLEQSKADTPSAPTIATVTASQNDANVTWTPIVTDTNGLRELATLYKIYRSATAPFTPNDSTNLRGSVTPVAFGASADLLNYIDSSTGGTN